MQEIRCGQCFRKLGQGRYTHLVIKCPRCGALNDLRATRPELERQRASITQTEHEGKPIFKKQ
ncbi:MAG: Com family DNA-binding transcriptional regulator [Desulfovibrionaceae bacterium]|nr:Com family DNA-binding transcriptional regulator [Desulfovibrionaceae bacterium]